MEIVIISLIAAVSGYVLGHTAAVDPGQIISRGEAIAREVADSLSEATNAVASDEEAGRYADLDES